MILLDPAGRTFDQSYAEELAQEEVIFICGHYEGYEQIKTLVTDEISLGIMFDRWRTSGHDHD